MDKPNVNNSIDSTQALNLDEPLTPIADLGVLSGEAADKNTQALLATSLDSTPVSQPGDLSIFKPSDVYSFSVADDGFGEDKSNINLSLNFISAGDDADLSLYRDSNINGLLDPTIDEKVAESRRGSNSDDLINVRTDTGDYFATVDRFAPGSTDNVQYQLDLSAAKPSNLLPQEFSNVTLDTDEFGNRNKTFTGSLNDQNTSDLYRFTYEEFNPLDPVRVNSAIITLTGLSADADVRVIRDFNNDQIVEPGRGVDREFYGASELGGNSSEEIFYFPRKDGVTPYPDSFIIQVAQYDGDTDYTLNVEGSVFV